MGFYTVLSLNRVDVNVRDIFASPPTPAPSPQGPKSYFYGSFLVLRTGTATIKKHSTIPAPHHKNEPTLISATPTFILRYATPN